MVEGKLRFNSRYTIMDEFDDAMLSFALRDAFPEVVFMNANQPYARPELDSKASLTECGVLALILFPTPGWMPCFVPGEGRFPYILVNGPRPYAHYEKSSWFWGHNRGAKWAFSLPTPEHGCFSIAYDPDIPEHKERIRAIHKIMNRVMTNRVKSGLFKDRPLKLAQAHRRSNWHWTGFHVMDWCRQDATRMLAGAAVPCDDWEPPNSPWHQRLREQVIQRYGADYGGPPRLPS